MCTNQRAFELLNLKAFDLFRIKKKLIDGSLQLNIVHRTH